MEISPSPIEATFLQQSPDTWDDDARPAERGVVVTADLRTDPPDNSWSMRVIQDEAAVANVTLLSAQGRTSRWWVLFNPRLAVGKHSGTFRVDVCLDEGCKRPRWQATIPYQLTIKPPMALRAYVNGRLVTQRPVQARDGDELIVESDVNVVWTLNRERGGSPLDEPVTEKRWKATATHTRFSGVETGRFAVRADSDAPAAEALVKFEISTDR
ncbi:MAG: hypothetical protein EOO22_23260 [Comamonadaceae bacterium]|nr:MAG: hypothetical protein EOO22_23260 [Comamonadaceae bacterium]